MKNLLEAIKAQINKHTYDVFDRSGRFLAQAAVVKPNPNKPPVLITANHVAAFHTTDQGPLQFINKQGEKLLIPANAVINKVGHETAVIQLKSGSGLPIAPHVSPGDTLFVPRSNAHPYAGTRRDNHLRVNQKQEYTQGGKPYTVLLETSNKTGKDKVVLGMSGAAAVSKRGVAGIIISLDTADGSSTVESITTLFQIKKL